MRIALALVVLSTVAAASAAHADDGVAEGDLACLAEAVYFEAGGTTEQGALAVAHVVQNRTEARGFPSTICGVVGEGCQFSYRCDGRPEVQSDTRERARAVRTAQAVLAGRIPDPTGGALFFHAAGVAPGWFATRPRVGEIAGNVYYR